MLIIKGFTGFGGFVILAIGLAMLGVTIWAFTNAALSFNQYTFLGILLGFDFLVILASIIGICGIKRQNGFMICVFQFFVMLFFLAFVGIGITAEILPKQVFDGDCTTSSNDLIAIAHNASQMGPALCTFYACGLKDSSIDKGNYTEIQKIFLKSPLFTRRDDAPVRFQDCDIAVKMNSTYQDMFNVLQAIETTLDCSGWCKNESYLLYTFSNVNNGRPLYTCYDTMKQKFNTYGNVVGIASFITAVFLMLVCVCGLCLCCAPSQKNQPLSSRFIVNDGGYYRTV